MTDPKRNGWVDAVLAAGAVLAAIFIVSMWTYVLFGAPWW